MKLSKVNQSALTNQVSDAKGGEGDGSKQEEATFEKHCSNDKVIQSIKDLIEKNKTNKIIL